MVVDPHDKKIKIRESYKPEIKKKKKVKKVDPVSRVEKEETESNDSDKLTLSIFADNDLETVHLNYREVRANKPAFDGSISDKHESEGQQTAKGKKKPNDPQREPGRQAQGP
jgi:hypothetical protein